MYMDEATDVEVAVRERPEQFKELHAAAQMTNQYMQTDPGVRLPTWMRDFVIDQ